MRKIPVILFLLLNTLLYSNNFWGEIGHRVVGEIATQNLTDKTLKEINIILDGESLASVSTWADKVKYKPGYEKYITWHYANMPLNIEYEQSLKNNKGDIVYAINHCISILKDRNSSKQKKSFYLKLLVHFLGDIHQPLHLGRGEDRGGNDIKINHSGKQTNLHSLWDHSILNKSGMRYDELSKNIINKYKDQKISLKTPEYWAFESHQEVKKIYSEVINGDSIENDYLIDQLSFVKEKLYKGGIRLAGLLNEIFG